MDTKLQIDGFIELITTWDELMCSQRVTNSLIITQSCMQICPPLLKITKVPVRFNNTIKENIIIKT